MHPNPNWRFLVFVAAGAACCFAGCAAALGPGYTIEKQEVAVKLLAASEPTIHVTAVYQLRNTGNQTLRWLELRLPSRQRYNFADPRAEWDAHALSLEPSVTNPRNVQLMLPHAWAVGHLHTLHVSVLFERAATDENTLSFAPDAFFLPAQGWSPELLPPQGVFATGGVPPPKWNLAVEVPSDFVVHGSGRPFKSSRNSGQQTVRLLQKTEDKNPFVVAGRFNSSDLRAGTATLHLWKRSRINPDTLQATGEALVRAIRAYASLFGARKELNQLWVVECPVVAGCFSSTSSNYEKLVSENTERASAEMAAADTVVVDLSSSAPPVAINAASSLAATWLGYGQNPGFFEQTPPLSAIPAFAAFRGREAAEGTGIRTQTIRQLLRRIPASPPAGQTDNDVAQHAKNVLFFYGLQDRFGAETLDAAVRHMLEARRDAGLELIDLVSAIEQESHQSVLPFVRLWMKHPGLPAEFRAQYESPSAAFAPDLKEKP